MNDFEDKTPDFQDAAHLISWIERQKRFSKKTTLDNMHFYASLLGNPEKKIKGIHVTGTNGKGSTVAMLRSIYMRKGLHVGTFTSPYITCFNERIEFDGKYISDCDLIKYSKIIYNLYPTIHKNGYDYPSFFDFITLIAFLYFADIPNLDIVIIEVGMGGRLDATNIFDGDVCVISNVAYDHMQILGNSLDKILKEKMGIIKNNQVLISNLQDSLLITNAKEYCSNHNSSFLNVDLKQLKIKKMDLSSSIFSYKGFKDLSINLLGAHQIENACVVIETVLAYNNLLKNKKSNLIISNEILVEGLSKAQWAGRLERVSDNPLIYLDGGHNINCITRVCEFINLMKDKSKRAVVAISNDKEKAQMIDILDHTFDEIVFTNYSYHRSAEASELFSLSKVKNKLIIENCKDTINYCYENVMDLTLFIGSLYLISDIRPLFIKNNS